MCALCVSRCILIFCLTECNMQQPAICNAVLCLHTASCNNSHRLARRGEGPGWGGGKEGWGGEEGWGGGESTPSPLPHHYTTHSPHRNDVIRKYEVSGSHVERLVSHQLKVGSCVTKSEEGFK